MDLEYMHTSTSSVNNTVLTAFGHWADPLKIKQLSYKH